MSPPRRPHRLLGALAVVSVLLGSLQRAARADEPSAESVLALTIRSFQEAEYRGTQVVVVSGDRGEEAATLSVVKGRPGRLKWRCCPRAGRPDGA